MMIPKAGPIATPKAAPSATLPNAAPKAAPSATPTPEPNAIPKAIERAFGGLSLPLFFLNLLPPLDQVSKSPNLFIASVASKKTACPVSMRPCRVTAA